MTALHGAGHLLLGLWCLSPAAAHQHAHQHAQHHRQQHQHQRHEPNLSSSLHNPSGSLHNHTALPTWTSHLPRLLVLSASRQAAHEPQETGSLRGALVSTCRCLASAALRARSAALCTRQVERRRVTELNRLTLICVLSMGAIISIGTMVVIVQAFWA